jgi:hypothetical protein
MLPFFQERVYAWLEAPWCPSTGWWLLFGGGILVASLLLTAFFIWLER